MPVDGPPRTLLRPPTASLLPELPSYRSLQAAMALIPSALQGHPFPIYMELQVGDLASQKYDILAPWVVLLKTSFHYKSFFSESAH